MTGLRSAGEVRHVQGALALLMLSAIVTLGALLGAFRLEPLPVAGGETPFLVASLQGGDRTPNDLIEGAVAAAPFTPTREVSAAPRAAAPPVSINDAQLQLVGTVVEEEGDSFVLASAANGPAKVVRVGETIAGHRLRSIGQGSAVFSRISDGERLELRVPRSR